MLGEVAEPSDGTEPSSRPATQPVGAVLRLPAVAWMVAVDDARAVESMMERLAATLLRMVGSRVPDQEDDLVSDAPLGPDGQRLLTVRIGRVLSSRSDCPFLRNLEISWSISDGWLVVGTDHRVVEQIVVLPAVLSIEFVVGTHD